MDKADYYGPRRYIYALRIFEAIEPRGKNHYSCKKSNFGSKLN